MNKHKQTLCPLCGEPLIFARSSKGLLQAVVPDPEYGHIYLEEGFIHEFEDHEEAIEHLADSGIPQHYAPDSVPMYDWHFCDGSPYLGKQGTCAVCDLDIHRPAVCTQPDCPRL